MNTINKLLTTLIILQTISACGGGGGGGGEDDDDNDGDPGVVVIPGTYQVLAFNDLGMHCADLDYSTFVILPPFNVVHTTRSFWLLASAACQLMGRTLLSALLKVAVQRILPE